MPRLYGIQVQIVQEAVVERYGFGREPRHLRCELRQQVRAFFKAVRLRGIRRASPIAERWSGRGLQGIIVLVIEVALARVLDEGALRGGYKGPDQPVFVQRLPVY